MSCKRSNIQISQKPGQSMNETMSQKAITDYINEKTSAAKFFNKICFKKDNNFISSIEPSEAGGLINFQSGEGISVERYSGGSNASVKISIDTTTLPNSIPVLELKENGSRKLPFNCMPQLNIEGYNLNNPSASNPVLTYDLFSDQTVKFEGEYPLSLYRTGSNNLRWGLASGYVKGDANGVAPLVNGTIPSQYLPSYVDDVLEYNVKNQFPQPGEEGKIYVEKSTAKIYRWAGSLYVEISPSLALGEVSGSAYPGDKGAQALKTAIEASNKVDNIINNGIGSGFTAVKVNNKVINASANKTLSFTNGSGVTFDCDENLGIITANVDSTQSSTTDEVYLTFGENKLNLISDEVQILSGEGIQFNYKPTPGAENSYKVTISLTDEYKKGGDEGLVHLDQGIIPLKYFSKLIPKIIMLENNASLNGEGAGFITTSDSLNELDSNRNAILEGRAIIAVKSQGTLAYPTGFSYSSSEGYRITLLQQWATGVQLVQIVLPNGSTTGQVTSTPLTS